MPRHTRRDRQASTRPQRLAVEIELTNVSYAVVYDASTRPQRLAVEIGPARS